ncbi:glycoside hydrolase family 15 protein [Streptomyces sp. cg35]|uniref:glycoside hydrolase family 15 protein n=1 Tax=Streptomyces sp. cg35 TaxID=3421650 RepID=UPI003D1863CB
MDLPVENHALLGDLETAALVGSDGSVDWLCLPRFDSPAACAALVGSPANGFWRVAPVGPAARAHRAYRADTLVLDTVWETPDGAVRITDFMPPRATRPCLVRRIEGVRGTVAVRGVLRLRFHQGRVVPWLRAVGPCTVAVAGPDAVWVRTEGHGRETLDAATGTSTLDATVTAGQNCTVTLVWAPSHLAEPPAEATVPAPTLLKETLAFWRRWTATCAYQGPWRPAVVRSLITWKALTYAPTGAVLSAPTTSLPYGPDGEHDGDGRSCRLDGFARALVTLLRCGLREEATRWLEWLLRTTAGDPGALQAVYGLAGERRLRQTEAPWLADGPAGYRVRFGDATAHRLRLDAYGEVLAALHTALLAGLPVPGLRSGRFAADLTRAVARAWPDAGPGIDARSGVLAWAALDRGARVSELLGRPDDAAHWADLREAIRRQVTSDGAGVPADLLMPGLGLLPSTHPRVRAALDAPQEAAPRVADTLLRAQGLAGTGRVPAAVAAFERVLAGRNDLGLLAERRDPRTGRRLGNAPSAASHLALVDTALALSAAQRLTADRSTMPESP